VTRNDQPLRALQTLVQFDMARIGAEVAEAAQRRAVAQREVSESAQHCEATAAELRIATGQSPLNPALLDVMQRMFRTECQVLHDSREQLAGAQHKERQIRARLAGLRNREHSLERALQAERRKRQLQQQVRDLAIADDMWLQQAWRELS
jgi:hypothetical protein